MGPPVPSPVKCVRESRRVEEAKKKCLTVRLIQSVMFDETITTNTGTTRFHRFFRVMSSFTIGRRFAKCIALCIFIQKCRHIYFITIIVRLLTLNVWLRSRLTDWLAQGLIKRAATQWGGWELCEPFCFLSLEGILLFNWNDSLFDWSVQNTWCSWGKPWTEERKVDA